MPKSAANDIKFANKVRRVDIGQIKAEPDASRREHSSPTALERLMGLPVVGKGRT